VHILEGNAVTKHFGGLAAVSGVDFAVDRGEVVGLIGPNGAGKTTLFNLISGALVPESGTIRFQEGNITGLKPHLICRRGLARTFQSVRIFPHLSVHANVQVAAHFGRAGGMSAAEANRETVELLEFVGLSDVGAVPAKDLKLPSQKRLEVARAMATKPQLLMLDELMAGLNHTEVAETMELVHRIRDRGVTLFLIEHVMKAIMGVCDRIIVLHHGKKIAEGTPQEIATSKTVVEVYLGE
jgi:branched-chain amino acid transport system ATP-binding protein